MAINEPIGWTIECDDCHCDYEDAWEIPLDKNHNELISELREEEWEVTDLDHCYCPICAERRRLENLGEDYKRFNKGECALPFRNYRTGEVKEMTIAEVLEEVNGETPDIYPEYFWVRWVEGMMTYTGWRLHLEVRNDR